MSQTNLSRTEKRFKSLRLLWKALSTEGKKIISIKASIGYFGASSLVNSKYKNPSDLDNKQDVIYDLLKYAQEQHEIELKELNASLEELLQND